MRIKYLVAASTFALVASSGAQAADIIHTNVDSSVVTAPAFSWQGFYAGGEIGGSWARSKVRAWDSTDGGTLSTKPDGFIGGLYAGYNFDAGNNIILGIDTDFLWTDVDGKGGWSNDALTVEGRVKQKWVGSTRVRVGYAADRWLPYVAGGVAYSRINTSVNVADREYSKNKTRAGWTVGAGVDYAMTDNVLLRVEYRYTDFGRKTYHINNADTDARIKYNSNDIRVGVAYKF